MTPEERAEKFFADNKRLHGGVFTIDDLARAIREAIAEDRATGPAPAAQARPTRETIEDLMRDLREMENVNQAGFYANSDEKRRAAWDALIDAACGPVGGDDIRA